MESVAVVVPTRDLVVFPGSLRILDVGRATSIQAIRRHMDEGEHLCVLPQLDPVEEDPLTAATSRMGVLVNVLRLTQMPDATLRVLVEGTERVRIDGALRTDQGATVATVHQLPFPEDDPVLVAAHSKTVLELVSEFLTNKGMNPEDHETVTSSADNPHRLSDQVAPMLELSLIEQIALLEEVSVLVRLSSLLEHLLIHIAKQRITMEVSTKVQAAMEKSQREYTLKEQLKAIRVELGEAHGIEDEANQFEEQINGLGLAEEVRSDALREVARLRRLHSDSAEYTIIRTWLETVLEFPWNTLTEDSSDLKAAEKILDEDHFGLIKIKERILEYLAVRQLNPDSRGAILCFAGPPGVGKTSLGRSIARALGRKYGRVALGGVKDESEVRGHRRTYVGALPGRFIRAFSRAGSRNPVIVLDEIDKLGSDVRGDPSSALLELLDPEQNHAFVDHYVDLPVDLSQGIFIATANVIDSIPAALVDRLEIIEIPGYIEEEKLLIAQRFLLPKLRTDHGLGKQPPQMTKKALQTVIREYTREAGLRELERQLATIYRKVARTVVERKKKPSKITETSLKKLLGPPRFRRELAERVNQPGVAIGLAWTASGGDILFIEAARMPGKHGLKLTGSLGAVMKESAEAAMSWLRSNASNYGVAPERFDAAFHLHVPAGAIPKDGPSAGVTMMAALASVVLERQVKHQVAMSGEITLRGKVLPVGGVKEKILAARRAGVRTIILPAHNKSDLKDVPSILRRDLDFCFVESVDEVLTLVLG
jgi:ATP-dependent Lon protease